jgi:hypothetical protein
LFARGRRPLPRFALLALALVACEEAPSSAAASSAPGSAPAPPRAALPSGSSVGSPLPSAGRAVATADACSYDWIELDEALRSCPALGDSDSSWVPRVETRPAQLKVASGGLLKFMVALGNEAKGGSWVAELDDHCGGALRPVLLDAAKKPVEDRTFWQLPTCPGARARVTLSQRGALTSLVVFRAVRRELERVVVGHETAPSGEVVDVTETRQRELALPPGSYVLELLLPTPHAQTVELPLEVTP